MKKWLAGIVVVAALLGGAAGAWWLLDDRDDRDVAWFEDVTDAVGLDFVDYDRDGRLDLVVTNYIDYDPASRCTTRSGARDYCTPSGFPGTVTRLFRNEGTTAGARFTDVTARAGLTRAVGPGLGVYCAD